MCWLLQERRGTRPVGVLGPRGAGLEWSRGGRALRGDAPRVGWPAWTSRTPALTRKAGRHHVFPRRHTGPCHVPLSAASRPAFGGRQARHPIWRPGCGQGEEVPAERQAEAAGRGGEGVGHARGGWALTLVSSPSPEAPIPAPSLPAEARLGHGLRSPVPRRTRRQAPALQPCLRPDPPPEFSFTPPHPPRLVRSRPCP